MEWDWKEFGWDPLELEISAGGGGEEEGTDTTLLGLSLGDTFVQESSLMVDKANDPKSSKTVSTPSGSTKRTRLQTGSQSIGCVVDGCSSDLSNCGDYHRRHRVCEHHSKAPTVTVDGNQQRFCQQCSRFHGLGEFDEVKRSCRKRLDGHNRRRRKPQPSPMFMSGPRILQFNNPQIFATPTVRNLWPEFVKNEGQSKRNDNDHHQLWYSIDQQDPAGYFTDKNGGLGTQFSVMQAGETMAASGVSLGSGKKRIQSYSDIATRSIDSSCALYLLSSNSVSASELSLLRSTMSPPAPSHNCEAAEKHSSSIGMKNKPACPVLIQKADTNSIICNGMLRAEPVESGDMLTIPFSWEF